jgi:signal transduction histidine kinase
MTLEGAIKLNDLGQVVEKVNKAVDDLDSTITEIRTAIFELEDGVGPTGLRHGVLELAEALTPMLGVRPDITFRGAIDAVIPQYVADHLLAVLREVLTNAGKHAQATRIAVTLSVADDIVLEVSDDGAGISVPMPETTGRGLSNLRARAEKLGGSFEIQSMESGGTRLLWCVPREDPARS